MKKILKAIGILLLILVALAAVGVGVLTLAEYKPADTEQLIAPHAAAAVLKPGQPLTVLSWNCGYGALGDNADFFMDGGPSVYTADKARVLQNLAGINAVLQVQQPDFTLLQEVDINSSRSRGMDERPLVSAGLDTVSEAFAYNYKCLFVPYPLPPLGHVEGGLYTLSRVEVAAAERVALYCPFSWPMRVVNLKRCLLVSRIPVQDSDKELVLINLHLEAYDDGAGKTAQTSQLITFLQQEYNKGNYVICGGDFNQQFLLPDGDDPYPVAEGMWRPGLIDPADFGPDFTLLMDASVPSCRSLDKAYAGADASSFQYYLIDGFIVSANVQVQSLETLDQQFLCADHNPVKLVCALTP